MHNYIAAPPLGMLSTSVTQEQVVSTTSQSFAIHVRRSPMENACYIHYYCGALLLMHP